MKTILYRAFSMAILSNVNAGNILSGNWSISGTMNELIAGDAVNVTAVNSELKSLYVSPGKNNLQYPADLDNTHYILFNVRKRLPSSDGYVNTPKPQTLSADYPTIALPLPLNLRDDRSVNYNDTQLGILGGAGAGKMSFDEIVSDSAKILRQFGGGAAKEVGASVKEMVGKALGAFGEEKKEGLLGDAALVGGGLFAAAQLGMTGNVLAAGYATAQYMKGYAFNQGVAYNPRLAVLFDNVNFRGFNFNYRMIARNKEESEMIRMIVKTFQKHMLPSYLDELETSSVFVYPDEFQIEFSNALKGQLFDFLPCVLKNVSVSYNSDQGPAFFADTNEPVVVDLSLQFQETQILTKEVLEMQELINEGFDADVAKEFAYF